jgi:two-component system, OmpR family, response regulator
MRWIAGSCLILILAAVLCVPAGAVQPQSEYEKILQIHLSPQGSGYVVSSMEVRYGQAPNLAIRSGSLNGVVLDANGKELQSFSFPETGITTGDILGPAGDDSLIGYTASSPPGALTITLPYQQDMQKFSLTNTRDGTLLVSADLNAPVALFCTDYPEDPDCLVRTASPKTAAPDNSSYLVLGALFAVSVIVGTGAAFVVLRSRKSVKGPEKQVVLIVDDDPEIVNLIDIFLGQKGFATIKATSGSECLDALKNQIPDMILLDVRMEPMDGWQTLKEIKRNDKTRSVPVLMLTANKISADAAKHYNLCIDDYITKPFNLDDLYRAVDGILTRKKKLKETLVLAKKAGVEREKFCELASLSRHISVNRKIIDIMGVPEAIPVQANLETLDDMLVVDYMNIKTKDQEKRAAQLRGEINTAFRSKGLPELSW